jgi:ATP-dependent DNA helicase RecG
MYDDHLEITNPGSLQFGITPEKLTKPHESKPWNPIIANVFYRAGIIERWGTGTLNIIDWCAENKNPEPSWQEQADSVYITFLPAALIASERGAEQVTGEVTGEVDRLLAAMSGAMSRLEIQAALNLKHEDHFRAAYLVPALQTGLIEMTIPDKPKSRLQKYRLTKKGKAWFDKHIGKGN